VLRVLRLFTRAAQANPQRDGAQGEVGSRAENENAGRLSSGDRLHGDDGFDSWHPHADSSDNHPDSDSRQAMTEHDQPNSGHL
jgi:hypothetical protein